MSHVDFRLVAALAACVALIVTAIVLADWIAGGAIQREFGDGSSDEVSHPDVVAFGDALHSPAYRDGEA